MQFLDNRSSIKKIGTSWEIVAKITDGNVVGYNSTLHKAALFATGLQL